ncbi:hypothetical protein FA13DRAFT_1707343 [Coprinellus micaceus]|uniref:Uncharacterized protein n=1 Tax=Coprinellus micaceus TaxID=71717 RepID=A0A4Y7TM06_COPMI|nr:hypothetical protein FA13DRAFT_1707343 [Coprinellus micaceus]
MPTTSAPHGVLRLSYVAQVSPYSNSFIIVYIGARASQDDRLGTPSLSIVGEPPAQYVPRIKNSWANLSARCRTPLFLFLFSALGPTKGNGLSSPIRGSGNRHPIDAGKPSECPGDRVKSAGVSHLAV